MSDVACRHRSAVHCRRLLGHIRSPRVVHGLPAFSIAVHGGFPETVPPSLDGARQTGRPHVVYHFQIADAAAAHGCRQPLPLRRFHPSRRPTHRPSRPVDWWDRSRFCTSRRPFSMQKHCSAQIRILFCAFCRQGCSVPALLGSRRPCSSSRPRPPALLGMPPDPFDSPPEPVHTDAVADRSSRRTRR